MSSIKCPSCEEVGEKVKKDWFTCNTESCYINEYIYSGTLKENSQNRLKIENDLQSIYSLIDENTTKHPLDFDSKSKSREQQEERIEQTRETLDALGKVYGTFEWFDKAEEYWENLSEIKRRVEVFENNSEHIINEEGEKLIEFPSYGVFIPWDEVELYSVIDETNSLSIVQMPSENYPDVKIKDPDISDCSDLLRHTYEK